MITLIVIISLVVILFIVAIVMTIKENKEICVKCSKCPVCPGGGGGPVKCQAATNLQPNIPYYMSCMHGSARYFLFADVATQRDVNVCTGGVYRGFVALKSTLDVNDNRYKFYIETPAAIAGAGSRVYVVVNNVRFYVDAGGCANQSDIYMNASGAAPASPFQMFTLSGGNFNAVRYGAGGISATNRADVDSLILVSKTAYPNSSNIQNAAFYSTVVQCSS